MKKYLWGGAALIVAGAAACYAGIDYASRHPESLLGRYGAAVGAATARCQPVETASTAVTGTAMPSKPVPARAADEATEQPAVEAPVVVDQGFEPIQVDPNIGWGNPGFQVIDPNVDFGPQVIDDAPLPMPYADEEADEGGAEVDWTACDTLGGDYLKPVLLVRLKKRFAMGAMEQNEACEQSVEGMCLRAIVQKMFGTDGTENGSCDDHAGRVSFKKWLFFMQQTSGEEACDDSMSLLARFKKWFYSFMMEQGEPCEPPVSDEVPADSMIEKLLGLLMVEQGEPSEEVVEPSWLQQLLDTIQSMLMEEGCRTNTLPVEGENAIETEQPETPPMTESNYSPYHHHGGCPYMGGCPYCPPCYPPQSAVRIPDNQDNNNAEETHTPAELKRVRVLKALKAYKWLKKQKQGMWELYLNSLGTFPCYPFTDTMECRPSDTGTTVVPNIPYFPLPY
jgi:hypothetical protein